MKDNFERFGCYLFLGTCKRKTNALLWPYLAASLINELGNACLACEAIILREQIEAHRFVLDFIFDVCLRRARDNVSILSCDGFLSRKMWKTNFISAIYNLLLIIIICLMAHWKKHLVEGCAHV